MIKIVCEPVLPRLRVRRVDDDGAEACAEALREQRWVYHCTNGGSVANAYKYPARTECFVAIASPDGRTAVWYGRAPANKVTGCGAALAATGNAHVAVLWDARRAVAHPLAEAACRVLHADVFDYTPSTRAVALAAYLDIETKERPSVAALMAASDDVFDAAYALVLMRDFRNARRVLAGKPASATNSSFA